MGRSQHFGYYDSVNDSEDIAQTRFNTKIVALLDVHAGMNVLDAGCGQGIMAAFVAKKCSAHVVGVTIVPHEIHSAQKRAHAQGVTDRTSFLLRDYTDRTIFKPSTFDRIYAIETLSHAPDAEAVMRNLYQFLKPGGKIVCAEYEIDSSLLDIEQRELARHIMAQAGLHGITNEQFAPGAFMAALRTANFKDAKSEDWTQHMKPSFDRLRKLAAPAAKLFQRLGIERHFTNTMAAGLYADGVERGAFRFMVYTASKPLD
jgi:ubiquinone/menaquinone biosynthesis C-methylase UbiE